MSGVAGGGIRAVAQEAAVELRRDRALDGQVEGFDLLVDGGMHAAQIEGCSVVHRLGHAASLHP